MRVHTLTAVAALALAACSQKTTDHSAGGEVGATTTTNLTDVDVAGYDLDMDKMRKWLAGLDGLTAAASQDSSVAAAIASSGNETTTQSIAKLEGNARAREILDKAGISPRDYVMTMSAFLRAAMADAAQSASPDGKAPNDVYPKNVEFIRAHRAELGPMLRRVGVGT